MPIPYAPESPESRHVLVVEADGSALDTRAALLAGSGYAVTTARGLRDLALHAEFAVAILSTSLSGKVLREIAEAIRRRWPRARILIIGDVQLTLDDHLYDDAVHHLQRNDQFLRCLARLSQVPA